MSLETCFGPELNIYEEKLMSDLNNIKIGNVKVTVLEDGYLNLPKEVLKNISPDIEKTLTDNAESDLVKLTKTIIKMNKIIIQGKISK